MAKKGTYSRPKLEKAVESGRKVVREVTKTIRRAPKDIASGTRSLGRMGRAATANVQEGIRKLKRAVK